jgi:hypothetical protein
MEVSKHQKFSMERVLRSSIRLHPKNPRVITDSAKKKLKEKMSEVGLLQPLIVNKTTGWLLGGHQRLASMDSLEKYKEGKNDYLLDVAMVELDEKAEAEMLVFLNNASASGSWNLDLLAELNLESGVSFDGMGFDKLDVVLMFDGDSRFEEGFADTAIASEVKQGLEEVKAARAASKEKMQEDGEAEHYFIIVCRDGQEKEDILKRMRVPTYERYISSEKLMGALK